MSDSLVIQSHAGPYAVHFDNTILENPGQLLEQKAHVIIDATVARLYAAPLRQLIEHPLTIVVEATEANKSLERAVPIFERLIQDNIRRDHTLVAIGGGIVQDLTCFVAGTLLRGVNWRFVPTTLLAQADSCIGSKSSINLGATKNIIGTFNPPTDVLLNTRFLDSLDAKDICSGVGEILKLHLINSVTALDRLAADYDRMIADPAVRCEYIRSALRIKQRFIEADEFDRGVRNLLNFGHTFGHAIESATRFAVPHGIAISMGMDVANHVATARGLLPAAYHDRMHQLLRRNYEEFAKIEIPLDDLFSAILRDKKNTGDQLNLILAVGEDAAVQRVPVPPDDAFRTQIRHAVHALSE